ncbi:MAG: histidinol dehydrogenase [Thermovirgaceae bacterium]|nr:histidinol dehydrogenase [Thermovirgaceae bacterium]
MLYLKTPKSQEPQAGIEIRDTAIRIIEDVRSGGLAAISRYSVSLDGYSGPLIVPRTNLKEAERSISAPLKEAICAAVRNIRLFHSLQKPLLNGMECKIMDGVLAGIRFTPVESTGIYIPGGRFPLPSTAFMGVIAAQEAGVKRIVALTPPSGEDGPHSVILGTLSMLGIREVWSVGGVQAVAAAAFGAGGLEPVDMFAGPGNVYVTEAKRILFGSFGIDGLTGPSEVLIIADRSAKPPFIAADLLAQSEHDPLARATLLCTDRGTAESSLSVLEKTLETGTASSIARESWLNNGCVAICTLEEAVAFANRESPEHIVLAVENPRDILSECLSFGSAFLGNYSAQSFGDYVAGTNHILPTGKSARFSGGVWTGTFMRPQTYTEIGKEGAEALADAGTVIAAAEGLQAHQLAMLIRIEGKTR